MTKARKVTRQFPRSIPSTRRVAGRTIEAAARLRPTRETTCSVMIKGWGRWRWPYFVEHALRTAGADLHYVPGDGGGMYRVVGMKGLIRARPANWRADHEDAPREYMLIANSTRNATMVRIDENYFENSPDAVALSACKPGDEAVMPYFAHPEMLQRIDRRVIANGWGGRPIRIGFAGTTRPAYEQDFDFDMLNRQSILVHLRDEFAHSVEIAGDAATWAPTKPIALAVTSDAADSVAKHSRTGEEYLDFLRSTEFVLTPPGLTMPHSHNLVEAMSQGAIPILNYASWVTPPLEPGVNCLGFSSLDQLSDAIRAALTMPLDQIREMRAEVLSYYERCLRPSSVGRQIIQRQPSKLYVNAEGNSFKPISENG